MASSVSASVFNALKRFTSCDVCIANNSVFSRTDLLQVGDALVKLKVPYGGYLHGLKMYSPLRQSGTSKIFGPAYTVQMVDANDKTAPKPSQHFADGVTDGSVVFVSQPQGYYSACWGGLMSTRAKYLGAQGVVIDGNFRDINEHRDLGFHVSQSPGTVLGQDD